MVTDTDNHLKPKLQYDRYARLHVAAPSECTWVTVVRSEGVGESRMVRQGFKSQRARGLPREIYFLSQSRRPFMIESIVWHPAGYKRGLPDMLVVVTLLTSCVSDAAIAVEVIFPQR